MNIELLPIAEKKIRQMGGEAMGVVVRNEAGALAAVTDMGRVTWLDDAVAGPVGDSAQGAEPVAKYSFYLGSGIRFFPLDAFEGLPKGTGYLYTQPAAKVPEELAAHIRKMIELHERRSVVLSIHMQELEELLDTTPQQSGEWVRCGDRLPTEDDADCSGEVWVFDLALGVAAEYYENVGNVPDYAYWMPTGLKRPNPPKQEDE